MQHISWSLVLLSSWNHGKLLYPSEALATSRFHIRFPCGPVLNRGTDWVCKLKKGLYELKQSRRLWYEQLGTALEGMGVKCLQSDPSIYIWTSDDTKIIILIFINDLILVLDSKQELEQVKDRLGEIFKLKDLGPTTSLLGMEVEYNHSQKTLRLLQNNIFKKSLTDFKCWTVNTNLHPWLRVWNWPPPRDHQHWRR